MKYLLILFFLYLTNCAYLAMPQDPAKSTDQFDCTNRCAALGMRGVWSGSQCGCEKK